MLAWIAAATIAASAPPGAPAPKAPVSQGPTSSDMSDALMDEIKTATFPLNGWTYLASAEDGIVFYRFPIQRQSGLPLMSTRWELATARADTMGRFLSVEQVQEMDCIQGLSRTVRRITYKGHNLVSPIVGEPANAAPWLPPDPGSLDEAVFKKACAPP